MKAGLLIIGDEVLSGNVQDTNSSFAARLLFANNIPVQNILAVSDTEEAIKDGIHFLMDKVDLIITTGGLGPTKDDITKVAIASYFKSELVLDMQILQILEKRYAKRGIALNELNRGQAMVPAIARVIPNDVGTAPVFWIEHEGKTLITLPGVPSEMRYLLQNELLERLRDKFVNEAIVQVTLNAIGIPESDLALKLAIVEEKMEAANNHHEKYKLAYLPDLNCIRLQITGVGKNKDLLEQHVKQFQDEIELLAGKYIFAIGTETIASYIGKLLKERGATLATAESCTGGYLAHLITSISGSSDYYQGTIVSYDNAVKVKELGVSQETLDKFGAVSEETCREMLAGCLKKFGTTYAIATTGIAGPGGEVDGKPVGTVWIGVADKSGMKTKSYFFNRNRVENIHLFSVSALDLLRKFVKGIE